MDLKHPLENTDNATFSALLGYFQISWNLSEHCTRNIISALLGDPRDAEILLAHMGSNSLMDILRTLAAETASKDVRDHVLHFVKFAETLREYRNYYMHGVHIFGVNEEGVSGGIVTQTIAKGRLVYSTTVVTQNDLYKCIGYVNELISYAAQILYSIDGSSLQKFLDPWVSVHPPPSSPKKPPLPDKLQKPRRFPRDATPQPQSSQE